MGKVSFKKTQKVSESMQRQRNGFFHLMCIDLQTDEVSYPIYSESRLAMYLEHASVDAICFDSSRKRSNFFECKYVSSNCAPIVTLELTHQNGKVGWALDECTMNNYIVFFLKGIGTVVCEMKVLQDAVKRNLPTFDVRKYNDSDIVQEHYDWLIKEAGGLFYPEEKLLHAEVLFRDMLARRLLSTVNEPGLQTFKYTVSGMVEMMCTDKIGIKKSQTIGGSLAFNMVYSIALSAAYNVVYYLI